MENKILFGDCLTVLRQFPNTFDMIYVDVPYYSQNKIDFNDKWKSITEYLQYLIPRIVIIKQSLKETGLLYLQCKQLSHYVKIELDKIFGIQNYRNEIIWWYNGGAVPIFDFPRKHDTIFRYSKSSNYYYNIIFVPYSNASRITLEHRYANTNFNVDLGTPITDVWTDIKQTNANHKHGYFSEKPIKLLERIILSSTKLNDIVLDPMCGSGTTCYVAKQLGRKFIGIDNNPKAFFLSLDRVR
jgi:DNA modification methylase